METAIRRAMLVLTASVKLGRVDDARKALERLKPLDAARAGELAEAISKGK